MKTDDLIRALTQDTTLAPPVGARLGGGLALALAGSVGLVGVVLGYRADLVTALGDPLSSLRFVLTLALFGFGLRLIGPLSRPQPVALQRFAPLAGVAGLALMALVWTLANVPPDGWGMALRGKTLFWCLTSIPVLSILPVAVLLAALRHGAPGHPALAGAMAGLVGSGGAAAAYALHCTEDSPLFYVTWYGLAILVVTTLSAIVGARLLRW